MINRYKYFFAAGIGILILIGVYFSSGPRQTTVEEKRDPGLLAKVGSLEIRAEQFKKEAERRSKVNRAIDKKALLDEMVDYEVLLSKALEAGLDKDPEIIRSYNNMLIGKLREQKLIPKIENADVTEEEIQSYYEANISQYTHPAKARLAIIYIRTDTKMSAEKLVQLQARIKEAREKASLMMNDESGVQGSAPGTLNLSFGRLAAEYSEDQTSRYRGGDIGWIDANRQYRWDPAVLAAGFALEKPGSLSDIVTTDSGLYLVKLTDKRESEIMPLEKVKAKIRHKMLMEKQRAMEKSFKEEMRATTAIELFPENLENINIPGLSDEDQQKPPHLP